MSEGRTYHQKMFEEGYAQLEFENARLKEILKEALAEFPKKLTSPLCMNVREILAKVNDEPT
jgi:hypothetical protein